MNWLDRLRSADVLRALADRLRARGITKLYGSACAMLGVLSAAYGLSVWSDGRQLWWHRDDNRTAWPARDLDGAARILVGLVSDQTPDGP